MQSSDWYHGLGETTGDKGVVAAGHEDAVAAGIAMLEAGGNAWDAIVAAGFASFVVEPAQCGIGGYARLAGFEAGTQRMVSVDAYLRAPAAVTETMFEIDTAKPLKYYETPWTVGRKAELGHLSVGVPGAVPGLWEAHRRWGRLPWQQVLEPAIGLADRGLTITWMQLLHLCEHHDVLRTMAPIHNHFCPNGELPKIAGQFGGATVIDLSELAATLRLIAAKGPAGMHEGEIARLIEKEVRSGGGILTAGDLKSYRPKVLIEEPQHFAGLDYVSCFCPTTYECLNILETFDLASMTPGGTDFCHVMAEASVLAFTDTIRWYGDPDHEDAPVAELCAPAFARRRAEAIAMDRALTRPVEPAHPRDLGINGGTLQDAETVPPWPPKLGGTTQITTADGDGNMAALCISLSGAHGSLVYCPGTGVVLNNGMQNFDPRPGRPNSLKPGKMPIFAAPVLVAARDGRAVFAAAGSGGYRILPGVLHSFVNWACHGMRLKDALEAPRVHSQSGDTFVDARLAQDVKDNLAARGHKIWEQRDDPGLNAFGRVCAVSRGANVGPLHGAAFPGWRCNTAAL
jgi:gamma-glutamyltranspeptidase/glutathione hydrolase